MCGQERHHNTCLQLGERLKLVTGRFHNLVNRYIGHGYKQSAAAYGHQLVDGASQTGVVLSRGYQLTDTPLKTTAELQNVCP